MFVINHQRHFSATEAILKAEYNHILCIMFVINHKRHFSATEAILKAEYNNILCIMFVINHQRHFSATEAILKAEYNHILCIMFVCSLKMALIADRRWWCLITKLYVHLIYIYFVYVCKSVQRRSSVNRRTFRPANRCIFLLLRGRSVRQLFVLPKSPAATAPLHVILQLKATTSLRGCHGYDTG